jgi:hypothetical protein
MIQENPSDLQTDAGSSRLQRKETGNPEALKPLCEASGLGGLPAPFYPFKG